MAIRKGNQKSKITYEVIEECGTVATLKNGDELKLRFMSWNGRDPKYDLRPWGVDDSGEEVCLKGIGLTGEQLEALGELINKMTEEDTE